MSKVSTRINREIINLQKNNDAFLISFDESNLRKFDVIIKAPKDTMTIESVLLSIQSLLDNTPYTHKPNQKNDKLFNQYVRFETFDTLLFSYIKNEKDILIKNYIQKYVTENYNEIKCDLQKLNNQGKFTISTRYNTKNVL